jgi:hypothetical protein
MRIPILKFDCRASSSKQEHLTAIVIFTAFHIELPFLELDYTASAKCRYQSHRSMDSQAPKKEHLMKSGLCRLALKITMFSIDNCNLKKTYEFFFAVEKER